VWNHAARVRRVVEAVERIGGIVGRRISGSDPPLVGKLVDCALVFISRLETYAERALQQSNIATNG